MLNNKTILITGGTGSFGKAFTSHVLKKYEAVELSDIQRKYLSKKFKIKTFKEINDVPKNGYDVVIIISVLEHVTDPVDFLKNLKILLRKKGRIIIECPSINDPLVGLYNVQSYKDFYYRAVHINYFNKNHLRKIVNKSGLKLLKVFSVLVYSLTNHLGWIFNNKGSKSANDATNVKFENIKYNKKIQNTLSKLNSLYFKELYKQNYADMEIVICEKK